MKKTLLAILAAATISGSFTATTQAAEITVKKGDSLWSVSKKYDISVSKLKDLNNLKSSNIHPGDKLEVGSKKTASKASTKKYIVKSGDTLSHIAKKYKVSVSSIKKWNKLKSDRIKSGQKLVVKSSVTPSGSKVVRAASTSAKSSKKSKEITMTATAYTASCKGCSGITRTGVNLKKNPNAKVIAVDPKVIPLGSKVYVEGYGYAKAADTGGAIKGKKIDVFVKSKKSALKWGRKKVKVKIVD